MGKFGDMLNDVNTKVGGVLGEAISELTEKGYIEQGLLAWVNRKVSMFKFESMFLGIKNGELMMLPIVNIKEYLYDKVEYYKKQDIKAIKMSGLSRILTIKFKHGGKVEFHPIYAGNSKPSLDKIVAIFSAK